MVCCIAVCVWYLLPACGIVCVAAAPAPIHPPGEAEGWPAAAAARETESLCYPGGGGGGVVRWCGQLLPDRGNVPHRPCCSP